VASAVVAQSQLGSPAFFLAVIGLGRLLALARDFGLRARALAFD